VTPSIVGFATRPAMFGPHWSISAHEAQNIGITRAETRDVSRGNARGKEIYERLLRRDEGATEPKR